MSFEAVFIDSDNKLSSFPIYKGAYTNFSDYKTGRKERIGIHATEDGSEVFIYRFSEAELITHKKYKTFPSRLFEKSRAVDVVRPHQPFAGLLRLDKNKEEKQLFIIRHINDPAS